MSGGQAASRRSTLLEPTRRLIDIRRTTREQAGLPADARIAGDQSFQRHGVVVHCAHKNQDPVHGRPDGAQGDEEGTSRARVKIRRAQGLPARHGDGGATCAAENAHSEAQESLTGALSTLK